jgi:hypothetical protein
VSVDVDVGVGAEDVRQRHRVNVVGLLAGDRVALAVAGHGHRVDGEHLAARAAQRRRQQSTRGLDRRRDRNVGVVSDVGE